MSAHLIALARAQALGLRDAAAACRPTQVALTVRLVAAADTLEGLAAVADDQCVRIGVTRAVLTACLARLDAPAPAAKVLP